MDAKINVAEILKDKPQCIRLYSPIFGECAFCYVCEDTDDICINRCNGEKAYFNPEGLYNTLGEVMLFPSKSMRDWSKFAWKEGDILVNKDGEVHIIFEGFDDDTYETFNGNNYLWEKDGSTMCFGDYEDDLQTSEFNKANKEDALEYIRKIEKRFIGKFNLETLETEKSQPEFKNGDIAYADYGHKQAVFIVSGKTDLSEGYNSFIALDLRGLTLDMGCRMSFFKKDLCKLRLATGEEKQKLFDALAEEGKAWDAEKKQIVDLKPKVEFKPFDKVLVRNTDTEEWFPGFFEKFDSTWNYPYHIMNRRSMTDFAFKQCIPYEGNEHLLGTTKDVEG